MEVWWHWLIIGLAAFLSGVGKTGIAGIGILSVALFATVLPARESMGTMLITLIMGDVVAVLSYRRNAEWRYLWRLFPWTAVGIIIGALALNWIADDTQIRRLIGVILVGLIGLHIYRQWKQRDKPVADPEAESAKPVVAGFTGIMAGFTTMVANAAGPIMTLYLLALKLPKLVFMGTTAWFFLFLNVFKVPFSIQVGMITWDSFLLALPLLPMTVIGGLVGRKILNYIDQARFEQLALGLTLVAGLRLLF